MKREKPIMKNAKRSCWNCARIAILVLVGSSSAADRATADDTELLRKKFGEVEAAIKAKDADKLWDVLSAKSQKDAEKIANEVREAYAKASVEEKRKQEEAMGLAAKDIPQLTAKGWIKGQSVWRKFHDLPGGKILRVDVAGDNATVQYLETDGDREKMLFVKQGGEWKAWLILPRPVNAGVLAAPGGDDKAPPKVAVADAGKHVNEKCVIEMLVKSTGKASDLVFLNSEENFREEKNFTVVLRKDAVEKLKAKIADPASHFKTKTVRVTGTIILYRDKPQIAVDDAETIQVVGEK
jgi:hypothetical protein